MKNSNIEDEINKAARRTVDYLYKIDGECSDELYQAIATLRQLINEEFVGKNKTVSSQFIYDIINKAVNSEVERAVQEARIDELKRVKGIIGIQYDPEAWYPLFEQRIAELQNGESNET